MSYDLFFYVRESNELTKDDIVKFLNENLGTMNEENSQWFVEHEEAETYYSIDYCEPSEKDLSQYEGYRNTNFSFNLNYFRPNYFGQEAFLFIDKFLDKLDLYVFNPQGSDSNEEIYKPANSELYQNWSSINARNCSYFFKEYDLLYVPIDKSNYIYNYRKIRHELWRELGTDSYYVSKFYIVTSPDRQVISLALLPMKTAVLVPKADFYRVTRIKKKWFRIIEESGLISHETFTKYLSHLFDNYKYPDSKILKLDKVNEAQRAYNEIPFDHETDYCQMAEIQKLSNYLP